MATTERTWETRYSVVAGGLPTVDQTHPHHQLHLHYPTVTFHNLGQKMKAKTLWHKKQEQVDSPPFCPEADIRETNLAYHIEVSLAGVKDTESLVIQWMSPRTVFMRGEISRPDIGHRKAAEGDRQWEGDTDGWAVEAKNPPKASRDATNASSNQFSIFNTDMM